MVTARLVPMTAEGYARFLARAVPGYAADKIRSGNWAEAGAVERARAEHAEYLPSGVDTPGHHLFAIVDAATGEEAGTLWAGEGDAPQGRIAYVYDLWIDPRLRRRGYASAALDALGAWASARGLVALSLHVFGHNTAARSLYERLGFRVTNLNLTKPLG